MKKATITLFELHELNPVAREIAIMEHGAFLDSFPEEDEYGNETCEYREHEEEEIVESIEANSYYFFENGEMASVTSYVGEHPMTGKEVFHFKGSYILLPKD